MILGFQDKIDIAIDAISNYSNDMWSATWLDQIEYQIYNAIVINDRTILSYFKPYQISVMRNLIENNIWIYYDKDINCPVAKNLDFIFKDKFPIRNGAD